MAVDAPLLSTLWYRVAELRPRLLARARLHRHRYRGEVWYLLQDPASGRVHRFTPAARLVLAAMDGRRNVHELWQVAQRRLGEDAPTQDEMIQLLGQLHGSDLLHTDVPPDALELFERGQRQAAQKRRRSWTNPMALRIPLVDPGRFLDRHLALWRLLWGRAGALLWLALVLPALLLLPGHWPELTHNLSDQVLQAQNLALLALVFPLVKALHELGHATATRAGGGEVHDMGLMLLVLMPVPYVDASASTVFRSAWSRALVGAAGMLVELFVAALAFYLWLAVEPGLVRALCFNVMVVAGVSTLLFNGNPLLRYDAYYILTDLVQLPNLAQQSTRYWGWLIERHVLRVHDAVSPAHTRAERWWFGAYGLASSAYRVLVTLAIALFIGTQFFFVGVVLALWALVTMMLVPVVRALRHLQARPSLRERRGAVALWGGGALVLLVLGLLLVPVPFRVQAEGVVWLPEQATLRAGADGFVRRFEVAPGTRVKAGQPLITSVDPSLDAQVQLLQARVAELEASWRNEFAADRTRADLARRQWELALQQQARVLAQAQGLTVVAGSDGVFSVPQPADLPGRFVRQGEVLGHVLGQVQPVVRVVVEQALVGELGGGPGASPGAGPPQAGASPSGGMGASPGAGPPQAGASPSGGMGASPGAGPPQAGASPSGGMGASPAAGRVALRLASDMAHARGGRIVRQVPAGGDESPSRALVATGGGRIAADPRDPQGRRTLERIFQVDVAFDEPGAVDRAYGQRVFVRFDLQPQPLATQWYHGVRRLFLRHFNV